MNAIQQLEVLIEDKAFDKEQLFKLKTLLKLLKKEKSKADFKLQRIQKNKEIVANVLNTTINELEKQKKFGEEQAIMLRINLEKLKDSYHELEQFSYIASHDLQSPLRTISNFAQLLQRKFYGQIDEEANEYIDFMVSGVKQMHFIITDLLKYAKVSDKKQVPNTKVNMKETIDFIHINLRNIISENKAQISVINPLPTLMLKKSAIIQLFQNLIENAIKFKSDKAPHIKIFSKQISPSIWEFKIKDNGIGMDNQYQNKVFLPFQRLQKQDRTGTGIGLAICKKVVKMHGGNIRYESVKGKGTTFIFTIHQALEIKKKVPTKVAV